jgi:neutral amino acid transport system ATP-binding protein
MLAGTLRPTAGTITFRGEDVTGLPAYRRARLGLVRTFQLASEFKRLTVIENLLSAIPGQRGDSVKGALLGRRYWGAQEREAVEQAREMLDRFGLLELADRYAGDLSGGERKMLAMGRALMLEPALVVLDEPTANLAPRIAASVLGEHVRQLATTGASVLVVEQRARAVLEISDRTYVLGGGRLLMEGTPAELSSSPEFVESFLGGGRR